MGTKSVENECDICFTVALEDNCVLISRGEKRVVQTPESSLPDCCGRWR